MTDQHEALRLADSVDGNAKHTWSRAEVSAQLRRIPVLEAERDAAFAMSKCECGTDEACANLARLHAELAALREQGQWRPIEDAPKDGTLLTLWEAHEDEPFFGRWSEFRGRWYASTTHYDTDGNACVVDRIYSDGVTHWLPLPPSPSSAEGA